jgi:hypothetical protein
MDNLFKNDKRLANLCLMPIYNLFCSSDREILYSERSRQQLCLLGKTEKDNIAQIAQRRKEIVESGVLAHITNGLDSNSFSYICSKLSIDSQILLDYILRYYLENNIPVNFDLLQKHCDPLKLELKQIIANSLQLGRSYHNSATDARMFCIVKIGTQSPDFNHSEIFTKRFIEADLDNRYVSNFDDYLFNKSKDSGSLFGSFYI